LKSGPSGSPEKPVNKKKAASSRAVQRASQRENLKKWRNLRIVCGTFAKEVITFFMED
jgi:hypothetical protein